MMIFISMKWTREDDNKLINLINNHKTHKEIGDALNRTIKSIYCRCSKLGIKSKIIHRENIICKECGGEINKTISNNKIFCDSSCSAKYNNTRRKHSEETKLKMSHSASGKNNHKWIDGRSKNKIKKLPVEEIRIRQCNLCGKETKMYKQKGICCECRENYYKAYHPSCSFNFDINKFKDEFDFSLIEKYGWYSPTNKGNNLNGISKDHIYSVKNGFINKINPEIINHPANCNLMIHSDNNKKKSKCNITLGDLLEKIKNWDNKYK